MQRGFTLIETVIVAAVVALLLWGAGLALGAHPLAMRTASMQFNSQMQAARALAASSGNGATIVVQPDGANGFKSILYGGRPNAPPLVRTSTPSLSSQAQISEAAIGAPPFAVFISSSGSVSVQGAYPPPSQFDSVNVPSIASEPSCPAAGRYVLTIATNGASDRVDLPCAAPVAGTPRP